jgi:hypothetical protein
MAMAISDRPGAARGARARLARYSEPLGRARYGGLGLEYIRGVARCSWHQHHRARTYRVYDWRYEEDRKRELNTMMHRVPRCRLLLPPLSLNVFVLFKKDL